MKDKFIDFGYKETFSENIKIILENIVKNFFDRIQIDNFNNFPTEIINKKTSKILDIKRFLELEKDRNESLKIKFSSLYIGNSKKIFSEGLNDNQNNGIFWNMDKRMLFNKSNICSDTIHSEVNLLSSVYNIDYKNILTDDLIFITSSRPCINCANSIKTFNNKIKQEGLKGIKYILLGKNELCIENDFKKKKEYTSSTFLEVLKILLDSGIRVFVFTTKSYNKSTDDHLLFFDYLLNENNIKKDEIIISEYNYQHIYEFDEILRK